MKDKKRLIISIIGTIIVLLLILVFIFILNQKQDNNTTVAKVETETKSEIIEKKEENPQDSNIDIVNVNSKSRPYAVVVNNTPVAVKVQEGLNKAYLVYEFPTEGNTSRLMALYKDVDELTIGTIRSSRHNFIDYALESDCIFIHFGWSKWAKEDQQKGSIDYLNGLFDKPFWRENPENLAVEHTAYTSLEKVKETVKSKGYRTQANSTKDTILLKYNTEDVDLSNKEGVKVANEIIIPYGSAQNTTTFIYDSQNKMYNRIEDGKNCIDHKTKEQVNTKNIIVQKITHTEGYKGSKYWDLNTIGSGEGYFITNGFACPITWEKASRAAKTKYYYKDKTEVEVSDGRTYIELQTTKQSLTIK